MTGAVKAVVTQHRVGKLKPVCDSGLERGDGPSTRTGHLMKMITP